MAGSQKVAGMHISLTAELGQAQRNIKALERKIDRFGRTTKTSMNRAQYAFNRMRRAAQLFASAFIIIRSVQSMGRFAASIKTAEDRMTLMTARFREFGRSSQTLTQVYNLSQKLGVSLEDTAAGMTRLLVATKTLNVAQERLLKVQENIVLLARAGGTSTEELAGGMRQLSQGLASGRLQGEELRSVLENIPLVAIEIADSMGITIGQIREFAKDGKITSKVIVDALEEIKIKAEDLPQTYAMATQRIATEWDLVLAALGRSVPIQATLKELESYLRYFREVVLNDFSLFNLEATLGEIDTVKARIAELFEQQEIGFNINADLATAEERLAALYDRLDEIVAANDAFVERQQVTILTDTLEQDEKALKKFEKEFAKFIGNFETGEQKVEALKGTLERFRDTIIERFGAEEFERINSAINDLFNEGIDEINTGPIQRMKRYTKAATDEMSEYAKQAARNMQDAFADFLFDPFEDGLKGMLKGFIDVIRKMMANQIAAQLFGSAQGIGFLSFLGIGTSASGAPAMAGAPRLVGERGPEIIVPRSNSNIIPNHKLGGSGATNNYYFEAGADVATIQAEIIPMLERTSMLTKNSIRQEMNEGRFR